MQKPRKPRKVDLEYYQWLISQIRVGPAKSFLGLFEIMHNTEFTWFVPNDDNRVGDALQLRHDFFRNTRRRRYNEGDLDIEGVSFLEVLVALSKRIAFVTSRDADTWAWRLVKNLGLSRMSDPLTDAKVQLIREILDDVIWRNYERNGRGGFFPLKQPVNDQTKIEIWFQMHEYVMEIEGMR